MNKATIYIDPNDDITDILSDLKKVKNKIVALVPPKKSDVLHSSVNIKLIQKTATELEKVVVLVTNDSAILKLAKASKVPVADSLNSRPVVPDSAAEAEEPEESPKTPEEITDSFTEDNKPVDEIIESIEAEKAETEKPKKSSSKDEEDEEEDNDDEDDEDEEKPRKKSKKEKKKKEKDPFKSNKKKWIIFGSIVGVAVIAFFIWALVVAPAVTIAVSIKTTSGNFSENITFVKNESDENLDNGVFYIREEKITKESSVKFTATGREDHGEKAMGKLTIQIQSKEKIQEQIPAGTVFSHNGLEFVSTNDASLYWNPDDENDDEVCEPGSSIGKGCIRSASISITAASPGEGYNVAVKSSDWKSNELDLSSYASVAIYNEGEISGGTSKVVTIVQQSDVDAAVDKLTKENAAAGKEELKNKLSSTTFPIETSFKAESASPVSTPAVGEEVKEGVIPSVSSSTTFTMFTLDSVRLEEFIKKKANIAADRDIYSVGTPFLEYFMESESGYSAKLKTTYKIGPKVTETEILEKSRGKKIGEVQSLLKSINGVNSVNISKSVFWVNSVPSDVNRVTIEVNIEE